jgi:hypothetical protein
MSIEPRILPQIFLNLMTFHHSSYPVFGGIYILRKTARSVITENLQSNDDLEGVNANHVAADKDGGQNNHGGARELQAGCHD